MGRKTDRKRAGQRGGKRMERKTKNWSLALLEGGVSDLKTLQYSDTKSEVILLSLQRVLWTNPSLRRKWFCVH